MSVSQSQSAFLLAQAELKRQLSHDLSDTKQLLDTLMSEKSTECSEHPSSEQEPLELPCIESVEELSLNVPVFHTTKCEEVF